jgi:hypothetical protein
MVANTFWIVSALKTCRMNLSDAHAVASATIAKNNTTTQEQVVPCDSM